MEALKNVKDIANRLTRRQKVILGIGLALSVIGMILMTVNSLRTRYALLYSGLDEATVAKVIDRLESEDVPYQYNKNTGALHVDKNRRDRLRMELAKDGLPERGQKGYELLDDLTGFGTTSEMFEASYWRAKEGEIARTVMSIEDVFEARVHIAPQSRAAFSKQDNQPSASVTLRMKGGAAPDKNNARAVKYLTALAVRGLRPDRVTVIDAVTGRLVGQDENDPELRQIQKKLELEQMMSANLEQLIGAHVGTGKVRVRVSVEMNREEQIVREKVIDPESRILISSDTGEISENSTEQNEEVTVTQNTPDGAANGGGGSSSNREETNERANYEISQTERERRIAPGATERLSVAVMVDEIETPQEDGTVVSRPRTEEELKAIEDLVKSASGFDPKRGDMVTVKSLAFVKPPEPTAPPPVAVKMFSDNFDTILQVLALLGSVAGVIFGVVRPIIRMGGDSKHQEEIAALRSMYEEQIRALTPPEEEEEQLNSTQVLISSVEEAMKEDPEEALLIIRQWLHETTTSQAKSEEIKNKKRQKMVAGEQA